MHFNVSSRCGNRYTHANRTCPLHPQHKPQRSVELVLQPTIAAGEDPSEVSRWIQNYRRERSDKTPAKIDSPLPFSSTSNVPLNLLTMSPFSNDSSSSKRLKTKRGLASELELEQENAFTTSTTPIDIPHLFSSPSPMKRIHFQTQSIPNPLLPRSPLKNCDNFLPSDLSTNATPVRRSALGDITSVHNDVTLSPKRRLDIVSSPNRRLDLLSSPNRRYSIFRRGTPPSSPVKTLNLKKRWLKEVVREQNVKKEDDVENLALPISWNETDKDESADLKARRSPLAWSAASALVEMAEREFSSNQPLNLSISQRK
jgi:hypothetical protein